MGNTAHVSYHLILKAKENMRTSLPGSSSFHKEEIFPEIPSAPYPIFPSFHGDEASSPRNIWRRGAGPISAGPSSPYVGASYSLEAYGLPCRAVDFTWGGLNFQCCLAVGRKVCLWLGDPEPCFSTFFITKGIFWPLPSLLSLIWVRVGVCHSSGG